MQVPKLLSLKELLSAAPPALLPPPASPPPPPASPADSEPFPASSSSNGGFLLFPVPALLGKHAASPSYKGPILLHHAGIWIQRETCMIIFGIWRWGSAGGVCVLEVGVRARHTSPCSDSFLRFPGFCFRQARAGAACDRAAVLLRLRRRHTAPSGPIWPPVR